MTVACGGGAFANAVTPHLDVEPFDVAAARELAAVPMHSPGVCFNPSCGAAFVPSRSWQTHCSAACRQVSVREFRMVGHKIAPALLAWRLHKRAPSGTPQADLCRAARRYITQVQTAWVADRDRRAGLAAVRNV
ncbi:hypothetical protein AN189_18010 [Loktanella sp. 3ANDIMAR09]|uniref:hypothetical protein n=1 Tax=Loktanella sp. 3ANDIMAR09 TaxID=1225657 RepID=UPI0006F7F31F|nr:hypothetical protein [Loktanella sp. 3ANDIMAR09]KQI66952.1 hypothetical protein AN189_18010 [Loktanella sp. 3ANDIMAR09]